MHKAKYNSKIIVRAVVTKADKTVKDLGIVSDSSINEIGTVKLEETNNN